MKKGICKNNESYSGISILAVAILIILSLGEVVIAGTIIIDLNVNETDIKTAQALSNEIEKFVDKTPLEPTPTDKWPVFDSERGVYVSANGHSLIRVEMAESEPTRQALVDPRANIFYTMTFVMGVITSVEGPMYSLPGGLEFFGGDIYNDKDVLILQAAANLPSEDFKSVKHLREKIENFVDKNPLAPTPQDNWPVFDPARGVFVAKNGQSLIDVNLAVPTKQALVDPGTNIFYTITIGMGVVINVEGPENLPKEISFGGRDVYTDWDVLYLQIIANEEFKIASYIKP